MIDKTTIKFGDMPRALAYLIKKVEELNCKLESLNYTSAPRHAEWMGIKELCAYLPTRRLVFHTLCSDALSLLYFPALLSSVIITLTSYL